jgi:hypothetical protein
MPGLRGLFGEIDQLLRGRYTRREDLLAGRIEVPTRTLVIAGLLLGALYGVFMGLYAVLRGGDGSFAQLVVTMIKVPLLFLLTLLVTFPSLYVFSVLAGSRLRATETLRLILVVLAVNLALLASLGPVTGFFTLSTSSYPFMIVLNVIFFAVSGFVGLTFLVRALDVLFGARPAVSAQPSLFEGAEVPPPVPGAPDRARRVFWTWAVVFGVVGAQMGWILRPFIGSPNLPFELFRPRESSFFEAFFRSLGQLFS